jgi:tetratricopeptide (TPR) repeat protein
MLKGFALGIALALAACGGTPRKPSAPPASPAAVAPASATPAPGAGAAAATGAGGVAAAPATETAPPPRAIADFNRAVGLMRAGNVNEAELEFQQITLAYPEFAGPEINLGILYRKAGRMDASEKALRAAVERNAGSAIAWNELGVTLRMRGQFRDAADAYQKAIAANADFAPAYRNLGVLLDLYLGDSAGALSALEHYKQLTGEDKPVSGWIAELRQRTGKPAAPHPEGAAPQSGPQPTQSAPASTPPPGTAGG